ncbi:helix-turn-helix domain-containing protein [Vibrio fluvialis]|jgi:excisionase family DNA binding protein|uniref:Excisionase family DNA binding protein n=3 Tax=Gammaproteobacteria TaxID=1236 RepID=A0A4V2RSP8_9GAMM|nr:MULTISPECIES: helix-turn-helix domain-containing protein [Gammaproteobacteria]ECK5632022.1 helix-turn-helix domain-containing protein [Salmonella enterica]ECT2696923.1 helix-turn-helix domain-containing protein [Salmonella enterica subsp. enterica serovar Montevideo]EHA2074626.1 helix-turn-helix domain-containing protein [Salmonella enterica subsp. enterica serovar Cerro]AKB06154.1 DNA binding, excisionase family domain protein [Vibrio cholerae]AOW83905.1 transcriptional regulator [Vibrio m
MTAQESELLQNLRNEMAEIKMLLAQVVENAGSDGNKSSLPPSDKEYLTVDEAAAYIGAKRSYIYRLTHEKRVSFTKPGGNRVLIKRSDLQAWLETNRVKSQDEIHQDVAAYITGSRRGRRAS